MKELRERLLEAIEALTMLRDETRMKSYQDQWSHDEVNRLNAKISGVKLALRYFEEMERG